jgi:hypothetical protein
MSKCEHNVITMQPSYLEFEGMKEPIIILTCADCNNIAGYLDPQKIEEDEKLTKIQYQYGIFPRLHENSQLKAVIKRLMKSEKEWADRAVKAEEKIESLKQQDRAQIKNKIETQKNQLQQQYGTSDDNN